MNITDDSGRKERANEYGRLRLMWAWKDLEKWAKERIEETIKDMDLVDINELTPQLIAEGRGKRLMLLDLLDHVELAAGMKD